MTRTALVKDQQDAILHYYNSLDNIENSLDFPYRDTDWANHPLNQGLVGYWPLRRHFNIAGTLKALDYSGNGNDGTINNGPVLVDDAVVGRITSFDGIDDAIDNIPQFTLQGDGTLLCWIKTTNTNTRDIMVFNGSSSNQYWYLRAQDIGKLAWGIRSSATNVVISTGSTSIINDGNPHMVAVTFARATVATPYVDGLQHDNIVDISATNEGPLVFNSSRRIARGTLSGGFFPGQIWEARVYSRALSADEIFQLYKLGLKRL